MDETTNPRTQGSLARQDTRCGNLEADQANARRVTPEGARTRIAARTSSIVFRLALLIQPNWFQFGSPELDEGPECWLSLATYEPSGSGGRCCRRVPALSVRDLV